MTTETQNPAAALELVERLTTQARATQALHVPLPDTDATMLVMRLVDRSGEETLAPLTQAQATHLDLLERIGPGPKRRKGTAHLADVGSLVAHLQRFQDSDSVVWADPSTRQLVAILDYHRAGADGAPRWGQHRGVYQAQLSRAFAAWGGLDGLTLSQEAFAALLDERDRELAGGAWPYGGGPAGVKAPPDPSALLTMANNLEVFSTATARRERDPNSGRMKVSFSEEKGVIGGVTPPQAFCVCIPVFDQEHPTTLEVRLRVDVEDGQASFRVRIHDAEGVVRRAFEDVCRRVSDSAGVPVYLGRAE